MLEKHKMQQTSLKLMALMQVRHGSRLFVHGRDPSGYRDHSLLCTYTLRTKRWTCQDFRLQDRCLKPCHKLSQRAQTWYREWLATYRTCQQLKLALDSLSDMATWYKQAIKTEEEFDSIVGQFINTIKTFSKPVVATPVTEVIL